MERRQFIMLTGGAVFGSLPITALAQARMRRIGILVSVAEGDPEGEGWLKAFLQELQALGWQRDLNVQIDVRWGASNLDRMTKFAKELVGLRPDLIQVNSTPATAAVLRETRDIPVLFSVVVDPVGSGLVTSLSHPGGNVTGFMNFDPSLAGKWVQLLKEIAPGVSRIAMLYNPDTAPFIDKFSEPLQAAGARLGMVSRSAPFRNAADIEPIMMALEPETGLVVAPDISIQINRKTIISLAARYRIAAVYGFRFYVKDGGLASYGVDLLEQQLRAAAYADRILKGANPGDLPVQLPIKFELTINVSTAKALGLDIPATLLARADEVIE
jgi:putative tryptophan/tyrosine transport system substrate-binding protein